MRLPVSAALLLLAAHGVLASEVPRLNIEAGCRAAPRLLAQDPNPYDQCMKDERAARSELENKWAGYAPEHRQLCVRETSLDGMPSYVEVLTCLQMYAANTPPRR
jgi:hypothetical protein